MCVYSAEALTYTDGNAIPSHALQLPIKKLFVVYFLFSMFDFQRVTEKWEKMSLALHYNKCNMTKSFANLY